MDNVISDKSFDFASKINIALKEATETDYWLKLLHKTKYITHSQYESLNKDMDELISILTAICKTANKRK